MKRKIIEKKIMINKEDNDMKKTMTIKEERTKTNEKDNDQRRGQ